MKNCLLLVALLLCLCIIPCILADETSTKDTNIDDTSLHQAVIDWLRSQEGGYFNPKQEIRREIPGDPKSPFGVFAMEDMEEGELLASIPWNCILTAGTDTFASAMMCDSIHVFIDELKKGNESSYTPYFTYLLQQPPNQLPSLWTEEAKDLLDIVDGYAMLPPEAMHEWIDREWKEDCQGRNDPLEHNMALEFLSRADDDLLIPVYDFYNHRNGRWYNTRTKVTKPTKQDVFASRVVKAGEQLYNSYNQCANCKNRLTSYGTPEVLRDYGFVEDYPRRWVFEHRNLGFDIDENEATGKLEVSWFSPGPSDAITPKNLYYLSSQLHRLQHVVEPELKRVETNKILPPHQAEMMRTYFNALVQALEMALESQGGYEEGKDDYSSCADGTPELKEGCMAHDGYGELDTMGEKDESFQTCLNEKVLLFDDYNWFDEIKSNYQTLTYMYREKDQDMCLDLDDIVQICTSYRPHYHEYVTHVAARYKKKIQLAVFVGGGDSMLLHELLKYPDIELIVGLELDQTVVRRSFEHFHTQPHFDDERVQWWFGDATKSLLMLPKEYFGSFDIVLVDLSETVMAFSVTKHLDILEALSLLLKPDGIFVKNEHYLAKLSEIFDYTMELYIPNNPIICDQAVGIGSNRIDFLHPDLNVMKAHNVEMLLLEPVKDAEDRFMHIHNYRKNDARAQGKCVANATSKDESAETSAGILMILEAENATVPLLEWKTLEGAFFHALQKVGMSPLTKVSHATVNGGTIGMILMDEGVVTARTWPEETYCAFDIQLWARYNKMEAVRTALAKVVGSSSLSSYRIVTGGMRGTKTVHMDHKTIGPRVLNNRNCEEKSTKVSADITIDEGTIDIVVEESVKMIGKGISVAVLCGNRDEACRVRDLLSKNKKVREVVAIYTCTDIESAPYFDHGLSRMFACEMETNNMLRERVAKTGQLNGLVLDANAHVAMAKVVERLLRNPRNHERLLVMSNTKIISWMLNNQDDWRKYFMGRCRRYIYSQTLDRAEVLLKNANNVLELGIVSVGDPKFYAHLVDLASTLERRTGLEVDIPKIEGGPSWFQVNFTERRFAWDDYDPLPAKKQFAEQQPLGEQIVLQLEVEKRPDLTQELESAIGRSLTEAKFSNTQFHVFEELGDGEVYVCISSEGSVVVVWDGKVRVDINLFTFESEGIDLFVDQFLKTLANSKVLLRDKQPRGIGRVINFKSDIEQASTIRTRDSKTDEKK